MSASGRGSSRTRAPEQETGSGGAAGSRCYNGSMKLYIPSHLWPCGQTLRRSALLCTAATAARRAREGKGEGRGARSDMSCPLCRRYPESCPCPSWRYLEHSPSLSSPPAPVLILPALAASLLLQIADVADAAAASPLAAVGVVASRRRRRRRRSSDPGAPATPAAPAGGGAGAGGGGGSPWPPSPPSPPAGGPGSSGGAPGAPPAFAAPSDHSFAFPPSPPLPSMPASR